MSDSTQNSILTRLLLRTSDRSRLWVALVALTVGTTLWLLSVAIWWNFNELLYGKSQNDKLGSTYLIIGKKVTEQNMGVKNATVFLPQEVDEVRKAPQVQEVGVITSNQFPLYAMMGGKLAFATDMVLESVPDKFIDKMPPEWKWEPGNKELPIIVPSQFLDIYNYIFAPSQGLPQLSETSVKTIALNFKVGGNDKNEMFLAHVVGFSDRIGSVLAPQSFIDYGNANYGKGGIATPPSQLILKTKDPSDTRFGAFLESHNYNTNSQNLRWSKMRAIVQEVASATGLLALLLMGIGTLVFILFIELTIARAQQSLTLLLQIGYSPKFVGRFMIRKFLPLVLGTEALSIVITVVMQYIASIEAQSQGLGLATLPGWPIWAALAFSTSILLVLVTRSIQREIH